MIDIKQGDCLELMKEIPNESIDCIITSPPYNKSFFSKQKKTNQIWGGGSKLNILHIVMICQ